MVKRRGTWNLAMPDATEPTLANGASTISVDLAWLTRVRFGARVLFWTILLSVLAANIAGSLVPVLAASAGLVYTDPLMNWVHLVPTVAGWPLLVGVFTFTTPLPGAGQSPAGEGLRRSLRVLASSDVAYTAANSLSEFTVDITDSPAFWLRRLLVGIAAMLVGLSYLRHLCRRFGSATIGRGLGALLLCYVALEVAGWGIYAWDQRSQMSTAYYLYWVDGTLLCWAFVWIWGLYLLRRFSLRLVQSAEGRCIRCGYALRGLTEARCPECGQTVQAPTAM